MMGMSMSLVARMRGGFNPSRLFSNGEPGAWFEANDANTLFTDVAGTTPVTAPGDAVALQLDKSGRGNHRTQATTAARPLYALHPVGGVRNLLEYTEEFNNAVWTKLNAGVGSVSVVTPNAGTAPNGTETADRLQLDLNGGASTSDASFIQQQFSGAIGEDFTVKIWAKSFDGGTYDVLINISGVPVSIAVATVTSEWQLIETSWLSTISNPSLRFGLRGARGTSDTADLLIWGAQAELGSTATNYQRVGSFLDVSEEGKARRGRIWYNGTSHFMETGTITPGTDKVQVFTGIRKLVNNDAAEVFFEASTSSQLNAGVLAILPSAFGAGLGGNAWFRSGGTTKVLTENAAFVAPVTGVLTGLGDISGDLATFRINGTQVAQNTGDQGTGNYLAYPLYFGARAGAYAPFNGYEDTSIIRFGPNLDDTTISKVESYVASKTPAAELLIPAGPELVTNGTFDTDVSGWTATRSASLALVSNTIEVTGTGTTQSAASQGITTTIGETYVVSFDLVSETGTARFAVSSQDNLNTAPDILNNLSLSAGQSYTFTFKANATTTYLHLASAGATDVTSWDNVSVRQLIPK